MNYRRLHTAKPSFNLDLGSSCFTRHSWSDGHTEESKLQLLCGFLPARSLDKLYNFAECAGLQLILGLNALHRNPDNSWNSSSSLSLLKYSAGKKYNISWELGNGKHNTTVNTHLTTHSVSTVGVTTRKRIKCYDGYLADLRTACQREMCFIIKCAM